mmetsp:Transcript_105709/g.340961  ORF Transcript_105709/g.340961 Transcript_105709/m.340961 type:complete len:358 (+) Transcript_105709:78-1151(+)
MARAAATALALLRVASGLQSSVHLVDSPAQDVEPAEQAPAKCPWRGRYREELCFLNVKDAYYQDLHASQRVKRHGVLNITKLKENVWEDLADEPEMRADFFESWEKIMSLQAADVLATKETWTEYDTELLQKLVKSYRFVGKKHTSAVTSKLVKSRLPKLKDLHGFLKNGSVAMVSGRSRPQGAMLGAEIDGHSQVVRFDRIARGSLEAKRTGVKHTMQVVGAKERGDPSVPLFDLDTTSFLRSYCQRLFEGGEHERAKDSPRPFMFTPTGFCKLPKDLESFSRPFLFFWFIGSLSDTLSMYGFYDPNMSRYNGARYARAEMAVIKRIGEQMSKRASLFRVENGASAKVVPQFNLRP